jgi:lipopolysaccharide/colanic/teichoic acid biosynthesis glycosyltransferase
VEEARHHSTDPRTYFLVREPMPLKRAIDLALTILAAPVVLPVAGVVAAVVKRKLGSPVLFRQRRIGLGNEPFTLVKFRSMTNERDEAGVLLPDAERLPPFGQWLRSTSLDELPELWNVVRGDMSLVGPRPLPVHYLPRYTATELRRHEVRPGVTGWAQINGRNTSSWDERLAMDVWYVEHRSVWRDLQILVRTVLTVLRRTGISAEGEATMAELPADRHAAR